jgi:hypothetical protein
MVVLNDLPKERRIDEPWRRKHVVVAVKRYLGKLRPTMSDPVTPIFVHYAILRGEFRHDQYR